MRELECPVEACGTVVYGFGRGSKELGIPTANLDNEAVQLVSKQLNSQYGIYYGWAWFADSSSVRYKMVMSFGLNPQYNNTQPTVEPHLIHQFDEDFYDARLCISIVGHIRDEMKFGSLTELIDRIHLDIRLASNAL